MDVVLSLVQRLAQTKHVIEVHDDRWWGLCRGGLPDPLERGHGALDDGPLVDGERQRDVFLALLRVTGGSPQRQLILLHPHLQKRSQGNDGWGSW